MSAIRNTDLEIQTPRPRIRLALLSVCGLTIAAGALGAVPDRPEDLRFDELKFEPPKAGEIRRELSSGVPVYMLRSTEFPLVTITFSFRQADHVVPAEKTGLAGMTRAMIRRGGTASVSAEDLDERFDFLAANVTSNTINCLTSNFDEAFGLFMDMVRNPGFQSDKVRIYKDQVLETMKQRNDDADTIIAQEASRILWGPDHHEARIATERTIEGITADDLRAYHERVYQPGNLIIGVVGDFDEGSMLSALESALAGWTKGEAVATPEDTAYQMKPGLYYVQKDIPQGKIRMMTRGLQRDDADYYAVQILNYTLGGSGFTSRMMKRIRSDEGLTYGVRSSFPMRVYYPGAFVATSFSKNRTVALTARMMMEEIARIRTEPISDQELDTAHNGLTETFPRRFESKQAVVNLFISDEWTGRDGDYWANYRRLITNVSKDDVLRVAKKYLDPADMAVLIVGNWGDIAPGDPTEQRADYQATMAEFGPANERPLLDPMTLKPLSPDDRTD